MNWNKKLHKFKRDEFINITYCFDSYAWKEKKNKNKKDSYFN